MEVKKFEFGKNYIVLDYKVKKLQRESAARAEFSLDPETFVVTLSLFNSDDLKLNETSFDLPLKTLITSVDLDYENKKLVFQVVDGTPIECDISELIDVTTNLISTTWQELKDKRDDSLLTPGQQYRITDYECTTVQEDTRSAGHNFDIIVVADSANKLNENARATHRDGDTYFSNSNLSAWKLKYCLDNDVNRFAWADSANGKGVIYRMIDEFNNDVPYDFKNIQFKKAYVWYHTFVDDLVGSSQGNKISVYISNNKATLNAITLGNNCNYNTFGESCSYITLGNNCNYNTFGSSCRFLQISDVSTTEKQYISVDSGVQGASSYNQFDLYDPAILNKNYQVTFKRDAEEHYVMTWLDDYNKIEGKYKDNNLDAVWKKLPQDMDGGLWDGIDGGIW